MKLHLLSPLALLPFVAASPLDAQTPLRTYASSGPGAVVAAGDVNGDGFDDVLDLDPLSDTVRVRSGQDDSTLWTFTVAAGNASFGWAAAGGVDCNGDGFPDIAIGSPSEVLGTGLPTGRVRLYSGKTGQLLLTLDGTVPSTPSQYGFGTCVALLRGSTSGNSRIAVGAPRPPFAGAPAKGSMHIFSAPGGVAIWSQYGGNGLDGFGDSCGSCVAAIDLNGDGNEEALFGCPGRDQSNFSFNFMNTGGVSGSDGIQSFGTAGALLNNQYLGRSIANAGDLNGDGKSDLIVSEPGYTPNGRIRALSWNGSSLVNILSVLPPFATNNFGTSCCALRWDSDNVPDIVTGIVSQGGGTARLLIYSGATGANILTLLDNTNNTYMAGFVSNVGDINNDGREDLFVMGTPNSPQALPSTIYSPVACTTCFPNGVSFCLGVPFAGQQDCPCTPANNSAMGSGQGCWNHTAQGARLFGAGTPSVGSDTLALTVEHVPTNANCLFFQGTVKQSAIPFGGGLRCVGGTTIRLGVMDANGSNATYPRTGDPLVSVKGQVVAGTTYYYQVEYRDSLASSCHGSTLNMSSGYAITWLP